MGWLLWLRVLRWAWDCPGFLPQLQVYIVTQEEQSCSRSDGGFNPREISTNALSGLERLNCFRLLCTMRFCFIINGAAVSGTVTQQPASRGTFWRPSWPILDFSTQVSVQRLVENQTNAATTYLMTSCKLIAAFRKQFCLKFGEKWKRQHAGSKSSGLIYVIPICH